MIRLILLALFSGMLWCLSSPAAAAISYYVTDLGQLPALTPFTGATGISSYGQVTGVSRGGSLDHEFLWTPTSSNGTSGSMIDLGGLGEATWISMGLGINSMGQVAGDYFKGGLGSPSATLWQPTSPNATTGTLFSLGLLPGGLHSQAKGINSSGQIAGLATNSSFVQHAILWSPTTANGTTGSMVELGDLPGGQDLSRAAGINDLGQVVGEGAATTGTRAFLWSPAGPNGATGSMVDLGELPGGADRSSATAINRFGQVVGESNAATGDRAFLWTPSAANGTTGSLIDLGDLPGGMDRSKANAINGQGVVVGQGQSASGQHAFIWNPTTANGTVGSMLDLNSLLDPASGFGWTLIGASGINDVGQIIGQGQFNSSGGSGGVTRAFLLTPIPEPSSAALALIVLAGLAVLRRRR